MNEYHEITIKAAAAKFGPAAGLLAAARAADEGHATFAGMSSDEWALIGYVLAATYSAILILTALPKLLANIRTWLRKVFRRKADPTDGAGA